MVPPALDVAPCRGTFPPLAGVCSVCLRYGAPQGAFPPIAPAPDPLGSCAVFIDKDPSQWLPW